MDDRSKKLLTYLRVATINLALLGAGLVVLEATFGSWFSNDPWQKAERLNILRDRQIHYDVSRIYGEKNITTYTRDAFGLRGTFKDPREITILTVGGSTTDQRLLSDGQTWQDILEQKLRAAQPDVPIHIANAGVNGHTSYGHVASFTDWFPLIPGLRPKYVLFYVGINDAEVRTRPSRMFDYAAAPNGLLPQLGFAIERHSALYRLYVLLHGQWAATDAAAQDHRFYNRPDHSYVATQEKPENRAMLETNAKHFRERFQLLMNFTRQMGARPICVSQPSQIYRKVDGQMRGLAVVNGHEATMNGMDYRRSMLLLAQVMKEECAASGGFYIDIESQPFTRTDFYDFVHMTPKGARKLGELLYEEMKAQGIRIF